MSGFSFHNSKKSMRDDSDSYIHPRQLMLFFAHLPLNFSHYCCSRGSLLLCYWYIFFKRTYPLEKCVYSFFSSSYIKQTNRKSRPGPEPDRDQGRMRLGSYIWPWKFIFVLFHLFSIKRNKNNGAKEWRGTTWKFPLSVTPLLRTLLRRQTKLPEMDFREKSILSREPERRGDWPSHAARRPFPASHSGEPRKQRRLRSYF